MASFYYEILDAVKTQVEGITGIPPVDLRFDLQVYEGESLPLVIVAPDPVEFERIAEKAFESVVWWDYPVRVALVWPGNRIVKAQLSEYLTLRQAIRDVIFKPTLVGVPTVFNTFVNPDAASKFAALSNSNYRVTGWEAIYRSNEERAV